MRKMSAAEAWMRLRDEMHKARMDAYALNPVRTSDRLDLAERYALALLRCGDSELADAHAKRIGETFEEPDDAEQEASGCPRP